MWVSREALDWAVERLIAWTKAKHPARRHKQNLYRIFMLKELGVSETAPTQLSTKSLSQHAERYLRVSTEQEKDRTGGRRRLFVPLSASYPVSDDDTKWAAGTPWTTVDKPQAKEYLTVGEGGGARDFQFKSGYEDWLIDKLNGNKIPALPLALFLLRGEDLDIPPGLQEADIAKKILEIFFARFKLDSLKKPALIFDLSIALP